MRLALDDRERPSFCDWSIEGSIVAVGYGTTRNLEMIFDTALQTEGIDAVLYHDADMVFEPEDVEALAALYVQAEGRQGSPNNVIACAYRSSEDPKKIVGTADESVFGLKLYAATPRLGTVEASFAERIGFGLVLIPTTLLALMDRPRAVETWDGTEMVTPDTKFCQRALALGANVWITNAAGSVRHEVTQRMGG